MASMPRAWIAIAVKCHGDSLPGRQQHVHFPGGWVGGDALGEFDQLIGGVSHGRNHDDHLIALPARFNHPVRHGVDPLGVGNRGSPILLDDEWHKRSGRVDGRIAVDQVHPIA